MNYKFWTDYHTAEINKAKDIFNIEGVKRQLEFGLLQTKANIANYLSKCESPIEQILFTTLYFSGIKESQYMVFVEYRTQETIEVEGHKYRADILVHAYDTNKTINIVVECDGHDFHEKTPEQAKRDKKRDRDMIKAGYHVLRFTGSEIVNDPFACVMDISKLIDINFPCPL
jgi:very-short-patch-repair endonuclease